MILIQLHQFWRRVEAAIALAHRNDRLAFRPVPELAVVAGGQVHIDQIAGPAIGTEEHEMLAVRMATIARRIDIPIGRIVWLSREHHQVVVPRPAKSIGFVARHCPAPLATTAQINDVFAAIGIVGENILRIEQKGRRHDRLGQVRPTIAVSRHPSSDHHLRSYVGTDFTGVSGRLALGPQFHHFRPASWLAVHLELGSNADGLIALLVTAIGIAHDVHVPIGRTHLVADKEDIIILGTRVFDPSQLGSLPVKAVVALGVAPQSGHFARHVASLHPGIFGVGKAAVPQAIAVAFLY